MAPATISARPAVTINDVDATAAASPAASAKGTVTVGHADHDVAYGLSRGEVLFQVWNAGHVGSPASMYKAPTNAFWY